ncbi:hypothetical protein CMI37_35285 [Candidatus Pacearchaeota archaeon]|nr:hypothetical protein [Candidatus Pacearchaeota archaeon]
METNLDVKKKFDKAQKETPDDIMGTCVICKKKGITKCDHKSLCAKHFIMLEDEECIKAYLQMDITDDGKITEPKEIQIEIKKQMPKVYEQLEGFFEV